jgi:hypothetical protein
LRFDLILAQYLYQYRKLNLPGLGIFEADSSGYSTDDSDRQRQAMEGITFIETTVSKPDDSLIEFIKEHTGKMKPLAISDLESYITLGKQFLYIGKPFYLEGIGTLQLAKDGRFEFIPGQYITTKLEDPNIERSEGKNRSVNEENRIKQESNNNTIKKVFLGLLVIGGLGLIVWGGYYLYNMYANQQSGTAVINSSPTPSKDSAASMVTEDSILNNPGSEDVNLQQSLLVPPAIEPDPSNGSIPGNYKFII